MKDMVFSPENLQVLDFYSKVFGKVKFCSCVTEPAIIHLKNSVLLCRQNLLSSGWSQIHSVAEDDLKLLILLLPSKC